MRHLTAAIGTEDLRGVQCLLLLALYGLFCPDEVSPWQAVGIAGRAAIAAGLHRQGGSSDTGYTAALTERQRVFQALYNLDRLVSATLCRPVTIPDADINAISTSPNVEDWPDASLSQRITGIRALSGQVLATLYSGGADPADPVKVAELEFELEQSRESYSSDQPGAWRDWLQHQYHFMSIMLYRPSPGRPEPDSASLTKLHDASVAYVTDVEGLDLSCRDIISAAQLLTAACSLFYSIVAFRSEEASDGREEGAIAAFRALKSRGSIVPQHAPLRQILNRLAAAALTVLGPVQDVPADVLAVGVEDMPVTAGSARLTMMELNEHMGKHLFERQVGESPADPAPGRYISL